VPYFDEISQSTAEIKLLPVSEKGRGHIKILLSVSMLTCHFASACQISQ